MATRLRTFCPGLLLGLCAQATACSDAPDTPADGTPREVGPGTRGSGTTPPPDAVQALDRFPPSDHTAHPSAGCGVGGSPAVGAQTLMTGGQEGRYLVTVPGNYDPNTPAPLGFVFHGANNTEITCRSAQNCPGVSTALEGDSIVVYPRSFGAYWVMETREQNVSWFDDLLAFVKANYCVDERRVYVLGTSQGAHFSNVLACRRGDELLAIAPGAGERLEKTGCRGQVAALLIHGVDDGANGVPFRLGEEARDYYAQANGCSGETLPPLAEMHAEVRAARDAGVSPGIFRCVDYQGCREGLPVRWCEHSVGGFDGTTHGYPVEGGATTWDFVSAL